MCKCLLPSAEKVPTKDTISTRSFKSRMIVPGCSSPGMRVALAMRKLVNSSDPTAVRTQHEAASDACRAWAATANSAGNKSVPGPNRTACACIGCVEETNVGVLGVVADMVMEIFWESDCGREALWLG